MIDLYYICIFQPNSPILSIMKSKKKSTKIWVIVVVLCALAFAIWLSSYSAESRMGGEAKGDLSDMRVAAQNYYDAYLACNSNPPPDANGDVDKYCQSHNPYGTASLVPILIKNAQIPYGVNPVICAQNTALATSVEKTTGSTNGSTGTVTVIENFGDNNRVKIKIDLMKEGDIWLVSNITCPPPPGN